MRHLRSSTRRVTCASSWSTPRPTTLDYNFIEAFDQPWKRYQEGTAGGYWGLFDEDRTPKFSWIERGQQSIRTGPASPPFPSRSVSASWSSARFWRHRIGQRGADSSVPSVRCSPAPPWCCTSRMPGSLPATIGMAARMRDRTAGPGDRRAADRGGARRPSARHRRFTAGRDRLAAPAVPRRRRSARASPCLRLAALLGAATVSLGLSFDPRCKDFPIAAYLVPALFFLVADIARGGLLTAL